MLARCSTACLSVWLLAAGLAVAEPLPVVDPGNPGPDLPPVGRSLFDLLTIRDGRQPVPFPFERLLDRVAAGLDDRDAYLGLPLKPVLIPLGRSLQRAAAAPDFFASPRVVVAVDAPTSTGRGGNIPLLLQDRLYIGYMPVADVLEIVSYNEAAARFEFQLVTDYREGGDPQVVYARRVVCIACHQNHAPIFARPLWDETNANGDIAEALHAVSPGFFGIPARQGVDVAYAIDNATDRANGFALTQKLWAEGCGDGEAGRLCRSDLLTSALQYRLSGSRGFAANPALEAQMATIRSQRWRDGLALPTADIPNRRPMATIRQPGADPVDALRDATDIATPFEPLVPREASVWQPSDSAWTARAVSGIAAFLSAAEVRAAIDARTTDNIATHELQASCQLTGAHPGATGKITLDCAGEALRLGGLLHRASREQPWRGRLRSLDAAGLPLGSVAIEGFEQADGLRLSFSRSGTGDPVRLSDGNALADARLQLNAAADTGDSTLRAHLSVQVREDFEPVRKAVEALIDAADSPLNPGPFPRQRLLALLLGTGATEGSPDNCCTVPPLPAARTTPAEPQLAEDPELAPFLRTCGACHRSTEPFPPNFLSGDAERVRAQIGQCAERIQYRLAMWDLSPAQRPKSPMPPHAAQRIDERELGTWRNGPLAQLRDALHRLATRDGRGLSSDAVTLNRPYASLRRCMAPA